MAMEGVTVDLSTNRGTGGEAMGDTLVNIELVWGSEHADTFIAGPGADIIQADGGSDTVSYEASEMGVTVNLGNNTGADADAEHRTVMVGGTGTDDDPYVFGADDDPATVAGDPMGAVAKHDAMGMAFTDTDNPETLDNPNANGAAGDKLGSIENLTGSDQNDSLTGDANPNVFKGMGGKDTLIGGAGADKLYGGDGDDTLDGGAGDNMLDGGDGDDTITGGDDGNMITGGMGDDTMNGGTGADIYVFSPDHGNGDDIIEEGFDTQDDKIDLSAFTAIKAAIDDEDIEIGDLT